MRGWFRWRWRGPYGVGGMGVGIGVLFMPVTRLKLLWNAPLCRAGAFPAARVSGCLCREAAGAGSCGCHSFRLAPSGWALHSVLSLKVLLDWVVPVVGPGDPERGLK